MGTTNAAVLRETYSGTRRELSGFDLTGRRFNHLAKLPTLIISDRSRQILNLRDAFPYKSDDGNIGDAANPGIAHQLEVQRCQSLGLVRITSTGGLPFQQARHAVQMANGVDVGHEFIAV